MGQGALAVECRADDEEVLGALAAIDHERSRREVETERAFLAAVGGGCELPVGAYAVTEENGSLWLRALLASHDGRVVLRVEDRSAAGADPVDLGRAVAGRLLAGGGRSLLEP